MKLEDLGYNSFFESNRDRLELDGFEVARVVSEFKGAYGVKNAGGEYLAKITGKQIFEASGREDYPAVGDWVAVSDLGGERAVIRGVLSRSSIIRRKHGDKSRIGGKNETQVIAANIDIAFAVESVDRDYNLNRFERYFSIAQDGGVKPAIILNKVDLIPKDDLSEKLVELKNRFSDIDVISTSAASGDGLDELKNYIAKGKTYCFLGSSGVGKSSLINKLLGENAAKTGDISAYSDRGKHITTGRQMYFLAGGAMVIDNPGMREVGITGSSGGIDDFFGEISALAQKCKFIDCTHTCEPGCAVIDAMKSGKLDEEKYSNYISLKREAEYYEASDIEKREKNRQFGKFIKNAKKELEKIGNKY